MSDTTIKIEPSTADLREAVSEWATKRFGATFGQDSGGACRALPKSARGFFDAIKKLVSHLPTMTLDVTHTLPARWVAVAYVHQGRVKRYQLRHERNRKVRTRVHDVTFRRDGQSIVGDGWA
jgi:hypothetical protein